MFESVMATYWVRSYGGFADRLLRSQPGAQRADWAKVDIIGKRCITKRACPAVFGNHGT